MGKARNFTDEQRREVRELKEQLQGTKIYRRIECVFFATLGYTNKKIAEFTNYSQSRVSDFVSEYMTNGLDYFREEHRKGGNNRVFTPEEAKEILSPFEDLAAEGKVVTIDEMKAAYDARRKKTMSLPNFYYFLKKAGWRRVMPRPEHPEKASDEAIEASKKLKLVTRS